MYTDFQANARNVCMITGSKFNCYYYENVYEVHLEYTYEMSSHLDLKMPEQIC